MKSFEGVIWKMWCRMGGEMLSEGDENRWADDSGDLVYAVDLEEKVYKEKCWEVVDKVLNEEYKREKEDEFERCFKDYVRVVLFFMEYGRGESDKKILECWFDFLESFKGYGWVVDDISKKVVDNDGGKD